MRSSDDRRAANQRGAEAEEYVAQLYLAEGWRIVARNLRAGGAELDLVVEKSGQIRFVEVKAQRRGDVFGFEVITPDKQRRLVRGALAWLEQYGDVVEEAVFDVVLVQPVRDGWVHERLDHAFDCG